MQSTEDRIFNGIWMGAASPFAFVGAPSSTLVTGGGTVVTFDGCLAGSTDICLRLLVQLETITAYETYAAMDSGPRSVFANASL